MYRKINNKILVGILAVLLIVVVLIEFIDARKGNRTFRKTLVEVNVPEVTKIEIYPKVANGNVIRLYKENDSWKVESKDGIYNANPSMAGSLVRELNKIKPESVVATKKDKWVQYEVVDSLGTRVKLFNGANQLTDLIIGKFTYSQPRKMTSYVRLSDEKEVYGVDGMLGMAFNRNLDSFRDRTVIKSTKTNWTKLTFTYPADSSFTLEKINDKWMIGQLAADSASVVQYFNSISHLTEGKFAKNKPSGAVTHRLKIEGNNGTVPVEITGYYNDNENFVVESSQNPGNFFNSTDLTKKLFVPSLKFIKGEK